MTSEHTSEGVRNAKSVVQDLFRLVISFTGSVFSFEERDVGKLDWKETKHCG